MARESKFQKQLVEIIESKFPGCFVMKNDSSYIQGIPDLTILHNNKWAVLEVKRSKADTSPNRLQPHQGDYIRQLDAMSYASFVYPENVEEVLRELQRAL